MPVYVKKIATHCTLKNTVYNWAYILQFINYFLNLKVSLFLLQIISEILDEEPQNVLSFQVILSGDTYTKLHMRDNFIIIL